ncbi:MAG: hypothetical protein H6678_14600 [Candidatus Delongbacteria bacterium]|nr:hypothetical protein [Candidatus Delongbacteria bacterium]
MRTVSKVLLTLAVAGAWQSAMAAGFVQTEYTAEELQLKAAGLAESASDWRAPANDDAGREGGPDANGYGWLHSNDAGGPTFAWVDATVSGTDLALVADDGSSSPIALPWTFTFYGVPYTSFTVCTNGFLNFGASSTAFSNTNLPATGQPNAIVAPFWDDLSTGSHGSIWHWYDSINDQVVIEFFEVPKLSAVTYNTFEVILRPDGSILMQYLSMPGVLTSATVGIENATGTIGLAANYNGTGELIADGVAMLFSQAPGDWNPPVIVHTPLGTQNTTTPSYLVSATVTDEGTLTAIDMIYNVGGGDVTVAMTNTVGDTWEASIPQQPDLTAVTYRVVASDDSGNGPFTTTSGPYTFNVVGDVTSFPYEQNFDLFATGAFPFTEKWANSSGTPAWYAGSTTPSGGTGATADHTGGGKFIYCETSNGGTGQEYVVLSPVFDLGALSVPQLKFWYHMVGATMGTLNVDVQDVDMGIWTDGVFSLSGQQQALQADPFLQATVDLTAYAGIRTQVRFRGVRGTSFTGDICVDDVFLGEAPSFDVALALDSFADPVSINGSMDVMATVTNLGATSADVDVELDYDGVAGADDTISIMALGAGMSQQVQFTSNAPGTAGNYPYSVTAVVTNGVDGIPGNNSASGTYDAVDSALPPQNVLASDDQLDQITVTWTAPDWFVVPPAPRPRPLTVNDLPFTVPADMPADKIADLLATYEAAHPNWLEENASRSFLNYNIYRDGNLVGSSATTTFVDDLNNGVVINTAYDYSVTALWDEEESSVSAVDSGMAVGRPTSGGPDALGYTWVNSNDPSTPATYDWVEISGIGTNLGIVGDDVSASQALSFSFPFYTAAYNSVSVNSNGLMDFATTSTAYSNVAVPSASLPNAAIFPLWDDLTTSTTGAIYYYDDVANSRAIFEWSAVPSLSGDGTYTFQVLLYADGSFTVQYQSIVGNNTDVTVGCEDQTGTVGLQVNFNDAGGAIADGVAIEFTPGAGDFVAPAIVHTQTIFSLETELAGDYTISADITDDSGVASATLTYDNGGGAVMVPMTNTVGDTYAADIPHQAAGVTVTYSIGAVDAGPNSAAGSTGNYSFTVVSTAWEVANVAATDGGYGATTVTWTAPVAPGPATASTDPLNKPAILDSKAQDRLNAELRRNNEASRQFLNYNIYRDGNLVGNAAASPFVDDADNGAVEGVVYTYTVTALYDSGESPQGLGDLGSFVARPTSGGPDAFGYSWVNSDDANGPAYTFVDIFNDPNAVSVSLTDDGVTAAIPLGFTFPFYGVDQSSIFIGANGVLSFGPAVSTFQNQAIPTADSYNNMICPFWDDLDPNSGADGTIQYLADGANNRFIVQYTDVPEYPGPPNFTHTFQAILNADGSILFNYQTMTGGSLEEATVGIENSDGSDALSVNYNDAGSSLDDGITIRIALASPAPVPVLSIVHNANNTVTLTWSDEGYASYSVYAANSGYGPFTLLETLVGTSTTYPSPNGKTYYYVVGNY